MGITNATIANAEDYQRVLSTHHPVFLFPCPACPDAVEAGKNSRALASTRAR